MEMEPSAFTRRRVLATAGAGAMIAIATRDASAQALRPGAHVDLIRKITGGTPPRAGAIQLKLPDVADNGASVPLTVSVDSPMTAQNHVRTLHVIAEENPNPEIISVHFTPGLGRAEVSTRIRLAKSQTVHAIAAMSDGSFWSTRVQVLVTVGGCGA
jgi:sulfur-oxidizing protein SoxY